MPWKKANRELMQLLEDSLKDYKTEKKMMFGSATFFINNNMFAGVHEDYVILRLSEADRQGVFSKYKEVVQFTPMGRVMKEYAALPEHISADKAIFMDLLDRSYRYTTSLPPKEKKKSRKKSE
jgi:TfoX/Sxy family transcriptional regulator of competence genes